ncbi:MAG: M56 family metallopeptidase [Pseudomonadota bacterium]
MTEAALLALATLLLTLPAAGLAYFKARVAETLLRAPRSLPWLWRAARFAAVGPMLVLVCMAAFGWVAGLTAMLGGSAPVASASGSAVFPIAPPDLVLTLANESGSALGAAACLLGVLYVTGLAANLIGWASRRRRLAALIASGEPAGRDLMKRIARIAGRVGVDPSGIRVSVVDTAVSPFLHGLRPVLVVPHAFVDGETSRFALAHELTHLRRADEIDRLLGELIAGVFWFNPGIAAIESRLADARELACDAQTLDRLKPGSRRAYAKAFAEACRLQTQDHASRTAFFGARAGTHIRRVKAMLGHTASRSKVGEMATSLVAALLALAVILPTGMAQSAGGHWAGLIAAQAGAAPARELPAEVGDALAEAMSRADADDPAGALAILDALATRHRLDAYSASVVHQVRAMSLFAMDDIQGAIDAFDRVLATDALTEQERGVMLVNIAQLHFALDQQDQGFSRMDEFLASGGALSPRLAQMLAQAYARAERFQDGFSYVEDFMQAVETPSASDVELYILYLERLGRTAEADAARERYREPPEGGE